MLKLETIRSVHGLDLLGARWRWLTEQCSGTVFQSYELNRRAAEWFAGREAPLVVAVESDSGIAIIPAVRRQSELGLIGETLFDYRDVLSLGDDGHLQLAWRALAQEGVPLEVTALRGMAVRERWESLEPVPFCNAPLLRQRGLTPEKFTEAHPRTARACRRLAREGMRLVRRQSGLKPIAEWVYRRKAEWKGRSENLFRDRLRQDFMVELVCSGAVDCTVWSYEDIAGEVAGALVTFRYGCTRHLYTIHHDERWERFSPGRALLFEVTRESLAEGLDVDFMTGEYAYKNRLASAMVPLYRVAATPLQMSSWNCRVSGRVDSAA
jgi:CelD/BcsL family acetyltransferase involved in cellulose biosynthesis